MSKKRPYKEIREMTVNVPISLAHYKETEQGRITVPAKFKEEVHKVIIWVVEDGDEKHEFKDEKLAKAFYRGR